MTGVVWHWKTPTESQVTTICPGVSDHQTPLLCGLMHIAPAGYPAASG